MFTIISLLLTLGYVLLMTFLVSSVWYFILIWVLSGIVVFYLISALQMLFSVSTFVPLLKRESKFKYFYIRSMAWWLLIFAFNCRLEIEGSENVPKDGKLTVYANHKSKIDPIFVTLAMKRPHGYAAKSDLKKFFPVHFLNKGMNAFYIYRKDNRKTLKELIKGIKKASDGHTYVIFPEGGTMYRDHQDITNVRAGAFKLAQKAETDILPITILNSHKWALRKFFLIPIKVKVLIHEPIKYEDIKSLDTNEIADIVIDKINEGI